jgi:hypothetical protein
MKRLPIWFERIENLAIAAIVVVVFVRLRFSWWWLSVFFLAFDASMAGTWYAIVSELSATTWRMPTCARRAAAQLRPERDALVRVRRAAVGFHIAGDRAGDYGLKFAAGFQDTHLGRIGKQRLPGRRASQPSRKRTAKLDRLRPELVTPADHRHSPRPDQCARSPFGAVGANLHWPCPAIHNKTITGK